MERRHDHYRHIIIILIIITTITITLINIRITITTIFVIVVTNIITAIVIVIVIGIRIIRDIFIWKANGRAGSTAWRLSCQRISSCAGAPPPPFVFRISCDA